MKVYTEQDLPMPVLHDKHQTYDANTSARVWFQKLQEEVMEAHEKAVYYQLAGEDDEDRRAGLAEELTDIKTVCETYLNAHAAGWLRAGGHPAACECEEQAARLPCADGGAGERWR